MILSFVSGRVYLNRHFKIWDLGTNFQGSSFTAKDKKSCINVVTKVFGEN